MCAEQVTTRRCRTTIARFALCTISASTTLRGYCRYAGWGLRSEGRADNASRSSSPEDLLPTSSCPTTGLSVSNNTATRAL